MVFRFGLEYESVIGGFVDLLEWLKINRKDLIPRDFRGFWFPPKMSKLVSDLDVGEGDEAASHDALQDAHDVMNICRRVVMRRGLRVYGSVVDVEKRMAERMGSPYAKEPWRIKELMKKEYKRGWKDVELVKKW